MKTTFRAISLITLALAAAPVLASRNINEQRTADPRGSVQINGVTGTIEVLGWDKSEVAVSGSLASEKDSVEVGGDPGHVFVQIKTGSSSRLLTVGSDGVHLTIHVPAASSVSTTLVSADFKTAGITGDLELHTVSGDSRGEVGGNLKASSVSGDIRLAAPAARTLAIRTVSGDIDVTGGDGETDISTISGSAHVSLGVQTHLHFKSTSGDIHLKLGLARDAQVEGEALSGDVNLVFRDAPTADFDVETHSGDIDNCFGPKPVEPVHGPGQRLQFKNGEGSGRVRIMTHSGDVELCTEKGRPS